MKFIISYLSRCLFKTTFFGPSEVRLDKYMRKVKKLNCSVLAYYIFLY